MTTDESTPLTLQDKQAQVAALQREIDAELAHEANLAHFRDDAGEPLTNPTEINDALLRAAGLAMQDRVKTLDWQAMSRDELHIALDEARNTEDFTGLALFAAVLNAQKAMAA